jgi:hypothetical protein
MFYKLVFIIVIYIFYSGCGLISKETHLEIVSPSHRIESLNLAPRHYRALDFCKESLKVVRPALLSSTAYLSPEELRQIPWISRVQGYQIQQCDEFSKRGRILADFYKIYSQHSNRIGLVLPPAASNEGALQIILDEFKATLKRNGVHDIDKALLIRRIERSKENALTTISRLIHMDRVSMVFVVNSAHAQAAVELADSTQVPVFLVNPQSPHTRSRQSMRIYPPIDLQSSKLLDVYKNNSISHVTVLYPHGADLELVLRLKRLAGRSLIFHESTYDPTNPKNMLNVVKSAVSRMQLVRSKAQGVLILDNFKMVRHLVNMIRSGASDLNIVMTGNQQWRSHALVSPREVGLEGGYFVDFIGSYKDLPEGLEVPIPEGEYFTTATHAGRIDFQLIGHRLGTLGSQVLKRPWNRQRIAAELQSLQNSWDNYFPVGELAFDKNRNSTWPVFLFRISGESIQIVKELVSIDSPGKSSETLQDHRRATL